MTDVIRNYYEATEAYSDYTTDVKESVFGSENDTMGATVTPTDMNSLGFSVSIDIDATGLFMVDSITAEVFYTVVSAGSDLAYQGVQDTTPVVISGDPILGDTIVDVPAGDPIIRKPNKTPSPWASCAIGADENGEQVMVSVGVQGMLAYSVNAGTSWELADTGQAGTLWGVAYASGEFLAVGDNGVMLKSLDGRSWTSLTPITKAHLYSAGYDRTHKEKIVCGDGKSFLHQGEDLRWKAGSD